MRESLAIGLAAERSYSVTPEMSPAHLPVQVLSTPSMIQLIESACLELAQPHLDPGETTVGIHVNVSHTGKASAGETVEVRVRLAEIDRRRLQFEIAVDSPRGPISTGTHQRAVIDTSRFT